MTTPRMSTLDWDHIWKYTGLAMQHLEIHTNKAGCCCLMTPCFQCPTHSLDLRCQDLRLSHWPVQFSPAVKTPVLGTPLAGKQEVA